MNLLIQNDVLRFNLQVKTIVIDGIALIFSFLIALIEYDANCVDYVMKCLSHDVGTIFDLKEMDLFSILGKGVKMLPCLVCRLGSANQVVSYSL